MSQPGARKRGRPVDRADLERIEKALAELHNARDRLRDSGCHSAAAKVRRAIASARGAFNNAWGQYHSPHHARRA